MFCEKCGSNIKDTAKFCPSCGAPVAPAAQPGFQQQPVQPGYPQQPAQPGYQQGYPQQPAQPGYQQQYSPQPVIQDVPPMQQMYAMPGGAAAASSGSKKTAIIIVSAVAAVVAIAVAVILIFVLGGDKGVVGKWHCVKASAGKESYDDEQFKAQAGYSLGGVVQIEFKSDGTGSLTALSLSSDFDWKQDGDDINISVASGNKCTASLKDSRLILTMDVGIVSYVYEFEKGEADDDANEAAEAAGQKYIQKSKLRSANSNAKLTYTTIVRVCADLESEGDLSSISSGSFGPVSISDLDDSDPVQKAIKTAFNDNGTDGVVAWEISDYKPVWAQWSESDSGSMVGQYPDAATDPDAEHEIGEKF